ncbi:MAG: hypothetical protein ACREP7_20365 [Lysobacter sp.]
MRSPLSLHALLACAALVACAAQPAFAQAPPCPTLPGTLVLHCAATEHGWFYAEDEAEAEAQMYAEAARQAAAKFERAFSRKPSFGAVVATDYKQVLPDPVKTALRERGAHWILPWVGTASMSAEIQRQVRQQFKKNNPNAGLTAARSAASDLAKRSALNAPGTVQHEIGHKLFAAAFWPAQSFEYDPKRYGSPAPDWLDEGAAMLMEPAQMTDGRRRMFAQMAAGELKSAPVQPLQTFLNLAHPRMTSPDLPDEIKAGSTENRVSISLSLDSNAAMLSMVGYYAQTRAWIDFLSDTGQRGTLPAMAEAFAASTTLPDWLARDGARYGLATDLPGLQKQWSQWLLQHYPATDTAQAQ